MPNRRLTTGAAIRCGAAASPAARPRSCAASMPRSISTSASTPRTSPARWRIARCWSRNASCRRRMARRSPSGLEQIRGEIESGAFAVPRGEHEDIHLNIEARLAELIGPAAGRLHTARSRNDQVATDFRLWVRGAIDRLDAAMRGAAGGADRPGRGACRDGDARLHPSADRPAGDLRPSSPGLCRDARARPRPARRLPARGSTNARSAPRRSPAPPFRSTATRPPRRSASTGPRPIRSTPSPTATSRSNSSPPRRSPAAHLSRFAEEIVLWSSEPFGFIRLSDAFTTGSSIMPQKRNPDAAELVRAKTGRLNGALVALLTVMKGLPLAYQKDMQEDKAPVFEAADALELCLAATAGMVRDLRPDRARRCARRRRAASAPRPISPTGWCARWACRSARRITSPARSSSAPRRKGCTLAELPLAEMQAVEPAHHRRRSTRCSTVERSVASRTSFGGTAPARVARGRRRRPQEISCRMRRRDAAPSALRPAARRAARSPVAARRAHPQPPPGEPDTYPGPIPSAR